MPDSYGKRQRNAQKARKFAAREERRAAKKRRRANSADDVPGREPSMEKDLPVEVDPDRDSVGGPSTEETGSSP